MAPVVIRSPYHGARYKVDLSRPGLLPFHHTRPLVFSMPISKHFMAGTCPQWLTSGAFWRTLHISDAHRVGLLETIQ